MHPFGWFEPEHPTIRGTGIADQYEVRELFAWVDAVTGERWECPAGFLVNGESIPRWLWCVTGHPFQQPGFRASVIHDAECVFHRRPSKVVHAGFYRQLRTDGAPWWRAFARWVAVRFFGPRW